MTLRTIALATLAAIGLFVVLSVVLTLVSIVVGLLTTLVVTVVALAVLVLAAVGLYRIVSWSLDGSSTGRERDSSRDDVVTDGDSLEQLQDRYVEGGLSEAEYERELERLMENDPAGRDRLDLDRDRDLEDSFSSRN